MNQNQEEIAKVKKKDKLYYAQILPRVGVYNVLEIIVRSVYDTYFVGIEKRDKHAYLFDFKELNRTIFTNRKDALDIIQIAEDNKKTVSEETYYEEY